VVGTGNAERETKMFKCYECGRKFKTAKAAEKASMNGCPKCGGVDIDLDDGKPFTPTAPNDPYDCNTPAPTDGMWTGFPTKADMESDKR
jgi:DNA-directed RNA polymerase subunit RPC12/RpoP